MHGRLKVRTTEEQRLIKEKEQRKKLLVYRHVLNQIVKTRKCVPYVQNSFQMSRDVLIVNPDVYTLWNYRKEVILQEIDASKGDDLNGESNLITFLENELQLTELCFLSNPKSYSSWHHRFWVLDHHPEPNWKYEFNLCTKYLTVDDRNFHGWDYRRLLINKIGITLPDEIKFSTDRININFSNYSSWHYRSTLQELPPLEDEIKLVQNAVFTDPNDSSAWFYLRSLLSNPKITTEMRRNLLDAFEQLQELDPDCKWILLAKCWLTGSSWLNDKNCADKRVEYYKKLKELDPLRKGQYDDCLRIAMSVPASGEQINENK